MGFQYTNAYIGPFCTSYAEGSPGDIQKFRFPVPVLSREHIAQGLMITKGDIRLTWVPDGECDATLGPGGSFAIDRPGIPLAIDAEVTLHALTPCGFLCVTAVGIEQKVRLDRYHMAEGERVSIERYALAAVAGEESLVSVNGDEPQKGIRLVYARDGEVEIVAVRPSIVGKFYFAG